MTKVKSIRDAFKTSPSLEVQGIELELANTRLRLARAGGQNTKYNAAMAKLVEKHKRAINHNLMNDEKASGFVYEVYAEHVVLSWHTNVGTEETPDWQDGIEGADGNLLPVSIENIVQFFKEMPDFFLEVKATAEDVQFYRQALVKDIAGN